jgi:hypothetical protein
MAEPITSRTAFKDYCLRRLGFPVIEINVDDPQNPKTPRDEIRSV